MNAEFVNPFIGGLLNVLETMAQTTLTPGKPKKKADDVAHGELAIIDKAIARIGKGRAGRGGADGSGRHGRELECVVQLRGGAVSKAAHGYTSGLMVVAL